MGLSAPPFNVRGLNELQEKLGTSPLPNSFNAIAVMNSDGKLNFNPDGCPYVEEIRQRNDKIYEFEIWNLV